MNWIVVLVAILLAWLALKLVVGVLKFVLVAAILVAAASFVAKKLR